MTKILEAWGKEDKKSVLHMLGIACLKKQKEGGVTKDRPQSHACFDNGSFCGRARFAVCNEGMNVKRPNSITKTVSYSVPRGKT